MLHLKQYFPLSKDGFEVRGMLDKVAGTTESCLPTLPSLIPSTVGTTRSVLKLNRWPCIFGRLEACLLVNKYYFMSSTVNK